MEKGKNLSFSKEVAETLGLECAIILNLFEENRLNNISSEDKLLDSINDALPFISPQEIQKSIKKLNQFNLIGFGQESPKKDYQIK